MTLIEIYDDLHTEFPDISETADLMHRELWGEVDQQNVYHWFESLANSLNGRMQKNADVMLFSGVFECLRRAYIQGDSHIQDCVNVSFTENLFWKVEASKARPYWDVFPDILKNLYIGFHSRAPA